jgi:hypothetical protein
MFKHLNFLQQPTCQLFRSKIVFHSVSLVFRKRLTINLLSRKSVSPVSSVSHTRETLTTYYCTINTIGIK